MMKRLLQILAILMFILMSSQLFAEPEFIKQYDDLDFPKLKEPNVTVETLPNGITCYLMEDNTLPVVKVGLVGKVGSIYEPADKLGIAALAGMLMRSGGAGNRGPEEFDEAVDNIGAVLNSAIGYEQGSWTLAVLSEDLENGIELLMDMVFRPQFDQERLHSAELNFAESLRREFDDPNAKATIIYKQLVYGKNNPWARRPEPDKLLNISQKEVIEFHRRYFKTGDMILAASGNFKIKTFLKLLKQQMTDVQVGKSEYPEIPLTKLEFKPQEVRVEGPKSQAFIRMGHLGVKRHNPDWFSLYVLSKIFGASSFKSRLMEDIRTKRGMAYSVWGGITQGVDYGLFSVAMSTHANQADEAVNLAKQHIVRLAEGSDVTQAEVDFAKRSILSSAIFELDSPVKIVNDRARFHFYGYPDNYWLIAYDGVAAVTKDDVNRVAEKYMHPDGLKILVLGPK